MLYRMSHAFHDGRHERQPVASTPRGNTKLPSGTRHVCTPLGPTGPAAIRYGTKLPIHLTLVCPYNSSAYMNTVHGSLFFRGDNRAPATRKLQHSQRCAV